MKIEPPGRPDPVAAVAAAVQRHGARADALLPILHELQDRLGHLPPAVVAPLARALGRSRAEVHGVITYYHDFRQQPCGRRRLRICRAEACQSVGAEALAEHAQRVTGCAWHQTSADGALTLEPVYCLGLCAVGPAVLVDDDELHARVTPQRLDELLATLVRTP